MITLYNNLPSLDLHGMDRDYARILINDFIKDHYQIKDEYVTIVHGNGTGIIKKQTQETLKKNPYVLEYKIDNFNSGMTIVRIKKKP
jgi:DNA mismatch repair protein MutS2